MKGLEQAQHVGTIADESEYICESSSRCDLGCCLLSEYLLFWIFGFYQFKKGLGF